MAALLEKIAREADSRTNIFLNQERAAYLQSQLAQPQSPDAELKLRFNLGEQLLLAGQTRAAVDEFEYIQRAIAQKNHPISPRATRELRDLLGLAYLRLGEQENCLIGHTVESCIFPIRGSGIHTWQEGSRAALREYTALLEEKPDDLGSRWLLNIAYMTLGEYPDQVPAPWLIPPQCFESDYDIKGFHDVAPGLGLDVNGLAGGSIMEDFDGDGYLDIMASSWGLRDQLRYFRNNGDGTFAERTEEAGLLGQVSGLNLCHADYNNDGYPDVLVLRGAWLRRNGHHPNSLLRNNGDGTFADVTEEVGLLSFHPTHSAAWGDYNNDGLLDLFVGNESDNQEKHPCELFRNNGDGTFTEVAATVGVDNIGYVKGVAWGDYNNDGLLDLYLSRLGRDNVLYRNEGETGKGWHFTDVSAAAGVTEPLKSFPTWFWDYDNDGWLDIFVAGFDVESGTDIAALYLDLPCAAERPRLFHNNRDGTFSDMTREADLDKAILAMGANFGDLDNDGFLDCYIGTGHPNLRALLPNRMFRNAGGKLFQDVTTSGGFGHLQKGHGISFGDIDNDGDQDIYEVIGGAYSGDVYPNVLFENPGHGNHWITLKLEGVQSSRDALGSRIKVRVRTDEAPRDIYAVVTTGGSFGSSSLHQEIGLGQARAIQFIEITWPATGKTQTFKNIVMDQILRIREGEAEPVPVQLKRFDLSPGSGLSTGHHQLPHQ